MKLCFGMNEYDGGPCVLALGTFDGVHLGHQALLRRTAALSASLGLTAAAMTFDRHPLALLRPEMAPPALTTPEEKRRLMEKMGIGVLIEEPFTPECAALEPEAFARRAAACLAPRVLVVGYNYTFGRGGKGNPALLARCGEELGFSVEVVPPVTLDGAPVSSTRIRALLLAGKTDEAARLLGRETVSGAE